MKATRAIPSDWFTASSILLGIAGSQRLYKASEFLEHLNSFPGIRLFAYLTEQARPFISQQSLHQFEALEVLSDAESCVRDDHLRDLTGLILVELDGRPDEELRNKFAPLIHRVPAVSLTTGQGVQSTESVTVIDLAEGWSRIFEALARSFAQHRPWQNKKVLVTAGRTEEPIDPVRIITNRSSGKMGFALARQAALQGADVWLITGPTHLTTPYGVTRIDVTTAEEMLQAADQWFPETDILFAAAAVEDLKPVQVSRQKIKKTEQITIGCTVAVDVLQSLAEQKSHQFLVGFSIETENIIQNSQVKLQEKSLDAIVANNPRETGAAFQHDTNKVTILTKSGAVHNYPLMSKEMLAGKLLDFTLREITHSHV